MAEKNQNQTSIPENSASSQESRVQNTESEEEIYVMPEHLKKVKRKFVSYEQKTEGQIAKPSLKKKTFPLYLIWIFIGLIVIGFGGLFYFKPNLVLSLLAPKPTPPIVNKLPLVNQPAPAPTPPPPQTFSEQTLKAEFKKDEEVISRAELLLPAGSLSVDNDLTLNAFSVSTEPQENYKIIGAIFKISSRPNLLKAATLKIFYLDKEIDKSWEDDLKIGYLLENYWIILPTEVDSGNNKLITQLTYFPSDTYAVLISQEKAAIQPTESQEIAPGILSSLDSDKDGLTDKEEEIYKTDKNKSDTDKDSYSDGLEIVNLYSPLSGPGDRLAMSDLVRTYSNQTFNYSLFYPTSWLVKVMPESEDKEVMISTEIGEFFSLSVEENEEMLSAAEWYKKQVKDLEVDKLKKIEVDGQEAVWSLDGLTLYIGKGNKIYVFAYNIGAEKEASLKSTFLMMIRSFKFLSSE